MDRRNLLMTATGLALAAGSGVAVAESTDAHHHHGEGSPLVESALHCVRTGDVCEAHCFDLLAEGDKAIAACARSVNQLVAVCNALAVLAANHSALLPRYASVARDACKACEEECRKHAEKHAPCKACADACDACARECAKIAA